MVFLFASLSVNLDRVPLYVGYICIYVYLYNTWQGALEHGLSDEKWEHQFWDESRALANSNCVAVEIPC